MTAVPQIFCRSCASPLVQATDWEQDPDSRWFVRLWCPECEFERTALLDSEQAGYLSSAIESGFAVLLEALEELQTLDESGHRKFDLVGRIRSERTDPSGY